MWMRKASLIALLLVTPLVYGQDLSETEQEQEIDAETFKEIDLIGRFLGAWGKSKNAAFSSYEHLIPTLFCRYIIARILTCNRARLHVVRVRH